MASVLSIPAAGNASSAVKLPIRSMIFSRPSSTQNSMTFLPPLSPPLSRRALVSSGTHVQVHDLKLPFDHPVHAVAGLQLLQDRLPHTAEE
jgi:hypothetical protein